MTVGHSESKIERQRAHFNSIAKQYREGRLNERHKRLKDKIWARALAPLRMELEGREMRVLEPMCGYAEGKSIITRHLSGNVRYSGFDYSDDVVEQLRDTSDEPDEMDVWHADVTTYRPAESAFDLIILIGGLHHVPDQARAVVRNLSCGLRPGGFFVNFEPTHGNPLFQTVRDRIYQDNDIFDQSTERAFSVRELLGMFEEAGLDRYAVQYPGLLAYVLYYNPYAFPALDVGGNAGVDATFALDSLFASNAIGRVLSFATLSIWRRP